MFPLFIYVTATMNTYGNKIEQHEEKKVEEDEDDYEDPDAEDEDYVNVGMEDHRVFEQEEAEDEDDYVNAEDYVSVEELGTAYQDEGIYGNC